MAQDERIRFVLPGVERGPESSRAHGPRQRGVDQLGELALPEVTVRQHFELSPSVRAAGGTISTPALEPDDVLAVEMEDGFVLYTSAGRLADDLRRIDPNADQTRGIPLDVLNRQRPTTRGLGDWIVRALSVLGVDDRAIVAKAVEQVKDVAADVLLDRASWAGTKALMWAIEQQLERPPGLYAWNDDGLPAGD